MAEAFLMDLSRDILKDLIFFAAGEIQSALPLNVKHKLKKLRYSFDGICAVLQDAEKRQFTEISIREWLKDLKDVVYDIEDVIDLVATDALHRRQWVSYYFSSLNFVVLPFVLNKKIKEIRGRLDDIDDRKRCYGLNENQGGDTHGGTSSHRKTHSYVNQSEIIGRDDDKNEIIKRLIRVSACTELSVLPILGIGGVGKTALVKLVYNDESFGGQFDLKLWACVSANFDLKMIIEDILEAATGQSNQNLNIDQLQIKLRGYLGKKRYFLVLDDVWNIEQDEWKDLRSILACGASKSVILVTTRDRKVASIVGTMESYNVRTLSFNDCCSLFAECVFKQEDRRRYPRLIEIGNSIVEKCDGLPLAVQMLGRLLCVERNESEWQQIKENDLWKIQDMDNGIFVPLKLSYDGLPSHVKPCFMYCSTLRKGHKITREKLINLWMGQGLLRSRNKGEELEDIGNRYFNELLLRSFLQETTVFYDQTVQSCKMHVLLHDFASYMADEERALVTCANHEVSKRVRHIVWDKEDLSEAIFPKGLLKARKSRTFTFSYSVGRLSQSFLEEIISNFRRLRILNFKSAQFEELPSTIGKLKHLRYLSLAWNQDIKVLPNSMCKLLNLQTLNLLGCEELQELPKDLDKLVSLKHLYLTLNQVTLPQNGLQGLTSLRTLELSNCKELISLSEGVGQLTSLHCLRISNCPKLASLPNSLKNITTLEQLAIVKCEVLDLTVGEGLQGLNCLRSLEIERVPKLVSLPDGLQSAASLHYLVISKCQNLVALPEYFQHFGYLSRLLLLKCANLAALPDGFRDLTALQHLDIRYCPHLSRRCAKDGGEQWPLISHIPNIAVDGSWIQNTNTSMYQD